MEFPHQHVKSCKHGVLLTVCITCRTGFLPIFSSASYSLRHPQPCLLSCCLLGTLGQIFFHFPLHHLYPHTHTYHMLKHRCATGAHSISAPNLCNSSSLPADGWMDGGNAFPCMQALRVAATGELESGSTEAPE